MEWESYWLIYAIEDVREKQKIVRSGRPETVQAD